MNRPLTTCGAGQVGGRGDGSDNSKSQDSGLRHWVDNETGDTVLEWGLGTHPELRFEHVESKMPLRHPSGCLGLMLREEGRARDTLVCVRGNGSWEAGCGAQGRSEKGEEKRA